jgi:hypothetical protein
MNSLKTTQTFSPKNVYFEKNSNKNIFPCFFVYSFFEKLQKTVHTYSKSASNAALLILILNFVKKMYSALQRKFDLCIPGKEQRGLIPNFFIHISVSDYYVPTIGPPILLQRKTQTDRGNT